MRDERFFEGCAAVGVEQVGEAREARAAKQRELLARFSMPLLCFTLNIPGQVKVYPLARRAFREGVHAVGRQLARRDIEVFHFEQRTAAAGQEAFWAVKTGAETVKRLMMSIEESHGLGRFFDIDVLEANGVVLSGAALGRAERRCIVCDGPVWACARSQAHPERVLAVKTARAIREYFDAQAADAIAACAQRALLYEVAATPKPGLVDRANTGAHKDMDFFTFMDSTAVLAPYFRDIARQSMDFEGEAEMLLPALRWRGQQAEEAMYTATGGVNTHKGAIFTLGIACAAAGLLYGRGEPTVPEALLQTGGRIAQSALEELRPDGGASYGLQAYAQGGLSGVRGEAAAGFPSVGRYALPVLQAGLAAGLSPNDAGVVAMLHLIAHAQDTNIAHRANAETLRGIQENTALLLRNERDTARLLEAARSMDAAFIAKSISPGGSADLLALAFFVVMWQDASSADQ